MKEETLECTNFHKFRKSIRKKLITAEQAAALVKDGDRVSYGLGCAAPYDIDIEIGKRAKDLHGVEIVATTVVKDEPYAAYLNSDSNEQIRFATAHMNGFERKMSKDGRCWFIPILFNELPKYWENIDKLIIQVHPMDQWGNFNLGPQASDLRGLIRAAKTDLSSKSTRICRKPWAMKRN